MTTPSTARIEPYFQDPDCLVLSLDTTNTNSRFLSSVLRKLCENWVEPAANDNSTATLEHSEAYAYDSGDADHNVTLGELFSISEYDASGTLQRTSRHGYDSDYRYVSKLTRSLDEGDFTHKPSPKIFVA